jgi:membrane associated rhomboid family serine protease
VIPIKDYNPTTRRAWITLLIIAVNVFVYFAVQPHGQANMDPQNEAVQEAEFTYAHAAIPCEVTKGRPLTIDEINTATCTPNNQTTSPEPFPHKNIYLAILYSMFLHGSLSHIGFNMLFLWIFGNNIEDRMGWIGYPLFYLASGFAAAFAHIVVQPNSTVPVVGASGAIAGVMGAYLVLFPNVRILSLIVIIIREIPAKWLLGFWFVLQFFTSPASGVAWVAHVGGFVFGMLVALVLRNRLRPPREQPAWFL